MIGLVEKLNCLVWHDGRYGMFVDQLRLPVAAQQDAEIVKPGYHSLQFDAAYQKNSHWHFLFSDVVEKGVLKILGPVCRHYLSIH